ncbi:MAG: hypothetical protein ACRBF0_21240 [Calditrichia bacterium]
MNCQTIHFFRVFSLLAIVLLLLLCPSCAESEDLENSAYVELMELHAFDQVVEQFNRDSRFTRVIALMSPGDPLSLRIFKDLKQIFNKIPDEDIRLYIVWVSVLENDKRKQALKLTREFDDSRLVGIWDAQNIAAKQWQLALQIDQPAWDVYLLYDKGHRWVQTAEPPDFWMRQLSGLTDVPFWDRKTFESKLREVIAISKTNLKADEG